MSTQLKVWYYKVKLWMQKHPHLTSLIGFVLFFLILAFALNYGWKIALIVLISLAVHEYSHALAMILRGGKLKKVYFIPLLGGVAKGQGNYSIRDRCIIALAGPLAGLLTTIPTYFLWKMTGDWSFWSSTRFIIFINLFNLIPIAFLDGGQVLNALREPFFPKKDKMIFGSIYGLLILWGIGVSYLWNMPLF